MAGEGSISHSYCDISLVHVYQFHTQKWTLRHGTTTASYVDPFGLESDVEFVRVVGKSSNGRNQWKMT